jgi:20S proteasome alpha/beta subunit
LQDTSSNGYTLREIVNTSKMTYILGLRCREGVVLVGDKKVTTTNEVESITFEYKRKIHGIIGGIVFGSSGSTDIFGLFMDDIAEQVKTRGDVTFDNAILKMTDIVLEMNKKRGFNRKTYFDLLVAIRYPDNRNSVLTWISGLGGKQEIDTYRAIGIGRIYGDHILEKAWRPNMSMEESAALGYFMISYIENFKLHSSVGIDKVIPQIWFIPDNERDNLGKKIDYEVSTTNRPEQFSRIKRDATKMLRKHKRQISTLYTN